MKKYLIFMVLFASTAMAQVTGTMIANGCGLAQSCGATIASIGTGSAVMNNATWLKWRNAANSANINVLEVDASDDTILNSDASDVIKLQIGGDANRLFTFNAASDTAHTLTFGDGGTTAAQTLTIGASTSDADDDSITYITGGGAVSASRGAYGQFNGNDTASGSGSLTLGTGADSGADMQFLPTDRFIIYTAADSQRLINFIGSSDTAMSMTFGDGGVTAAQTYIISASTADADDDSVLNLTGGGALGSTRGAYLQLYGNEATSSGNVNIGAGASGDVQVLAQDDTLFYTGGSTLLWSMGDTGTLIGAGTASIGWSVVAGANTACTTTCTTPAVLGFDTAVSAIPVGPSDATADICLCAGAS